MLRLLLALLLVGPGTLSAQAAEKRPPLRSGTAVRVFVRDGPAGGARGVVVSGGADTLRVISPALGLAQLPADTFQRLETIGASGGRKWKYVAGVLAARALAGAGGGSGGEDFFPMFMNGLIVSSAVAGAVYVLGSSGQRASTIDLTQGLPPVPRTAGDGVPVRIAFAGTPARVDYRLRDFTADSVYLASEGALTSLPRAQVTSLQVSMGRDRRRGARRGALIGGVAGGLLAGGALASLGDSGVLFSPFAVVGGGVLGAGLGVPVGSALAPRAWSDVPVRPER
jgi:hypothetical protein